MLGLGNPGNISGNTWNSDIDILRIQNINLNTRIYNPPPKKKMTDDIFGDIFGLEIPGCTSLFNMLPKITSEKGAWEGFL